ncbi:MAG: iron-containing alcohol dehydrogenase [Deltaproteobacteria bacterium]|nr:iron-containing alcohol dehydrogenase [bacterium]MCB9487296.1 iron-containing alcohol dehydrogenase [Deltaproteobacteria bacterium]
MADKRLQALPTYGNNLLGELPSAVFDDLVVLAAPEPWEMLEADWPNPPNAVATRIDMELSLLEMQLDALPRCEWVLGLGGGTALDAAKMYAWRTGAKLVLAPSILSVDAAFTKAVGVRVGHRVRYVGEVLPEHLLVDFDLLRRAPAKLNRAGIGDILSIFTALNDWQLAHEKLGERFDPAIAAESKSLLESLWTRAVDIREGDEVGLKLLSELFVAEVRLCEIFGNSRPEEGSEHYFAYCLESLTHGRYVHGELVALAVLLTGLHQGQDVAPVIRMLDEIGVEYRPGQVGVTRDEIRRTLLALPEYIAEETQLLYGVYHDKGMNAATADELIEKFEALL